MNDIDATQTIMASKLGKGGDSMFDIVNNTSPDNTKNLIWKSIGSRRLLLRVVFVSIDRELEEIMR